MKKTEKIETNKKHNAIAKQCEQTNAQKKLMWCRFQILASFAIFRFI